jgi:chemotaxis signal transduction protein
MSRDDDKWSTNWPEPPKQTEEDESIVKEAVECGKEALDYEAEARSRFDYDYKFANGDAHNKYQWDADVVLRRELEEKPILTINKVQQHNLLIINDSKQNKYGIRVRPVSDEATFQAAEIYQELVYHVEYISSAENVYDSAIVWQVEAGKGFWYVDTDYENDHTFNQEIYIRPIKDPRSVLCDPHTIMPDDSDMRWALIVEELEKSVYRKKYPKYAALSDATPLLDTIYSNEWAGKDKIRLAIFYKKEEEEDRYITFIDDKETQQEGRYSQLTAEGKKWYNDHKDLPTSRERNIVTENITKYKIAGNRIVEKTPWLGKIIPVVKLAGVETVIDGVYDCRGHTRALINAQQMYNYNTSSNTEFGAQQTKSPWVAPQAAIAGYEEYYRTASNINHSYLPYNHMDDDGNAIPAPQKNQGIGPGTAYIESLKIAQNEMMMASGQWQSQVGENENAKSGVAINARQRQGDKATYHFIDNQAIAIRKTGKIIIDLIPKVYDTERVKKILARDGRRMHIQVKPGAEQAMSEPEVVNPDQDITKQITKVVFDPTVGDYDIQSDSGPSYATRRQEQFNALTQIAAQNKEFMQIGGDLYFKSADFPDADILAERWRRIIPPNVTGDAPNPHIEAAMHAAADQIQQLHGIVGELQQQLKDKETELSFKAREIDLKEKEIAVAQQRADYEAETKRVVALGNSGPGISVEQIQPVLKELLAGMIANGELVHAAPGVHEGGTIAAVPKVAPGGSEGAGNGGQNENETAEQPPVPGAQLAQDGAWYIPHEGGYARVEAQQ